MISSLFYDVFQSKDNREEEIINKPDDDFEKADDGLN